MERCSSEVPAFEISSPEISHQKREATIGALKARLASVGFAPVGFGLATARTQQPQVWNLGAPAMDALLGPAGLELGGVHEVALSSALPGQNLASVVASARWFALALLHRRLAVHSSRSAARVLWCATPTDLAESGHLYAPALMRMGFDPDQFIFVTPPRAADVLWAMEEGVRSGALAAVVGQIDDVGLTPARRLALAAAATGTPCLLVANERAGPVAAVATRWRIGPLPSGPTPSGPRLSGPRLSIGLERCRARPVGSGSVVFAGEWSDDAHCFRVVDRPADRAIAAEPGTKDRFRSPEPVG